MQEPPEALQFTARKQAENQTFHWKSTAPSQKAAGQLTKNSKDCGIFAKAPLPQCRANARGDTVAVHVEILLG
jgi:hypothetical protein